jgi:[acyl-carrier-protein] S-malonyltransferase
MVVKICAEYSGDGIVEAVNFNANGQVVIAGNKAAVDATCEAMKTAVNQLLYTHTCHGLHCASP